VPPLRSSTPSAADEMMVVLLVTVTAGKLGLLKKVEDGGT
jgi:hypothetical protein